MKKLIVIVAAFALSLNIQAQEHRKFSPEKFQADMEAFITKEADLTPQEAAKLFPLFREMHEKQRVIYDKMHAASKSKPSGEPAYQQAIIDDDKLNIELRQTEAYYHKRMMKEIPASKVYEVIKAEFLFHRRAMKGWHKDKHK